MAETQLQTDSAQQQGIRKWIWAGPGVVICFILLYVIWHMMGSNLSSSVFHRNDNLPVSAPGAPATAAPQRMPQDSTKR